MNINFLWNLVQMLTWSSLCFAIVIQEPYRKTLNMDVTNDTFLIAIYERYLVKCLAECNLVNECEFVIYVGDQFCKLFKVDALPYLTTMPGNSIMYKKEKINTNGLRNYWPLNQNFKDKAGSADFYNCINASPAEDRFNIPYSAIYFNVGACQVKPDVYFNGNFSILAWVKVLQIFHGHTLLDFNNGPTKDQVFFYLSDQSSSQPVFQNYNDPVNASDSTSSRYSLDKYQWYHVAVVYGSLQVKIYINGKNNDYVNTPYISNIVSKPSDVIRNNCFIGRTIWNLQYANAYFDDIKIYNRSLSYVEILNDYY